MAEGQDTDSKSPEVVNLQASNLSNFIRRNLDGEFAEVFAADYEIGLPSAQDTIVSAGKTLGNLIAERIIRPESKDLVLTFIAENDSNLTVETVRFRIPRYRGVSPYYEYSKVLNDGSSPEPLKNNPKAEDAIRAFGKKVGKILGKPEEGA